MKTRAQNLASMLHRFQPEGWKKDRENALLLSRSTSPLRISIVEASFDVDCQASITFQHRVDLILTGIIATLLFLSCVTLFASMGGELISSGSAWGWWLLLVIPLGLLVLIPGLFVVTMYLTLILLPISGGVRYLMSLVSSRLSLVSTLRRL